ncbi:hypothetical protein M5689_002196 [Euphorbia peplus]|nr:hypothetical protein M5689_002196 [Euphorbia peplus]
MNPRGRLHTLLRPSEAHTKKPLHPNSTGLSDNIPESIPNLKTRVSHPDFGTQNATSRAAGTGSNAIRRLPFSDPTCKIGLFVFRR